MPLSAETPDAELIQLIRGRRDEAAMRFLFRRHSPRLLRLLVRLCGGRSADADDILQDTWLRAAKRIGMLPTTTAFYPWLRGISLNVHREYVRSSARRWRLAPSASGDSDATHDQVLQLAQRETDMREEVMDLERIIHELPEGYRTILVLHDLEGFTHDEIAERLGIQPGTSKSQLFAARRAVRRLLHDPTEQEGSDVKSGKQ